MANEKLTPLDIQLPPLSIVDTRQPDVMKLPFIRAGWQVRSLKYGDYWIQGAAKAEILIEDKPVNKLLADMASGTLHKQIRGLTESCDFPILLIRGHWYQAKGYFLDSSYTWEQVWNQLQTLQDLGCRIQLAISINHAVERIMSLEKYYQKDIHESALRHVSGDHRLAVLSLIPGICEKKADSILRIYPTLKQVAEASLPELKECKGIGEVLSERIWKFWRYYIP